MCNNCQVGSGEQCICPNGNNCSSPPAICKCTMDDSGNPSKCDCCGHSPLPSGQS
jgi:hypothetical protein